MNLILFLLDFFITFIATTPPCRLGENAENVIPLHQQGDLAELTMQNIKLMLKGVINKSRLSRKILLWTLPFVNAILNISETVRANEQKEKELIRNLELS